LLEVLRIKWRCMSRTTKTGGNNYHAPPTCACEKKIKVKRTRAPRSKRTRDIFRGCGGQGSDGDHSQNRHHTPTPNSGEAPGIFLSHNEPRRSRNAEIAAAGRFRQMPRASHLRVDKWTAGSGFHRCCESRPETSATRSSIMTPILRGRIPLIGPKGKFHFRATPFVPRVE
jgi:hypothetical protein